jgi:hypothetical protein
MFEFYLKKHDISPYKSLSILNEQINNIHIWDKWHKKM